MRSIITIVVSLIITSVFSQNINDHRWQNRVLIIQTSSDTSQLYQQQFKEFKNAENAFIDRKLVIYEIVGNKVRMTDYKNDKSNRSWKVASKSVNAKFMDNVTFKITLIGLDGGIKLDQTEVLKKNELFQIIDAMPMRRFEIKAKQKGTKQD